MSEPGIETIDFRPRIPFVRLVLACLAFGVLGWAFVKEKRFEFNLADRLQARDVVGTVGIGLLLLLSFCFITSFLLLQFRLRFTEQGIRRITFFPPRFIPWSLVRTARVISFKGYLSLELWISRRRWINVPILEYRKGARLLDEIRRRLPVEVQVSEQQLTSLGDER